MGLLPAEGRASTGAAAGGLERRAWVAAQLPRGLGEGTGGAAGRGSGPAPAPLRSPATFGHVGISPSLSASEWPKVAGLPQKWVAPVPEERVRDRVLPVQLELEQVVAEEGQVEGAQGQQGQLR